MWKHLMSTINKKKPIGAQTGNKNRQIGDCAAEAHLHIRCTSDDKSSWTISAQKDGSNLSAWITKKLNS